MYVKYFIIIYQYVDTWKTLVHFICHFKLFIKGEQILSYAQLLIS